MAFWWVNHNKTFTSEIEGGYIWSPMTNKTVPNQTYTNLTLTNLEILYFLMPHRKSRQLEWFRHSVKSNLNLQSSQN